MRLQDQIIDVIAENLSIEREKITLESHLIHDLGADSLDIVEMVMAFEDKFGVSVADEDQDKIQTVGDVVRYIHEHQG